MSKIALEQEKNYSVICDKEIVKRMYFDSLKAKLLTKLNDNVFVEIASLIKNNPNFLELFLDSVACA